MPTLVLYGVPAMLLIVVGRLAWRDASEADPKEDALDAANGPSEWIA